MTRTKLQALLPVLAIGALFATTPALNAQTAGNGYLKVKANPGRAGVFVDGKYVGPASNFRIAKKYSLPAGEHELVLREPRYEEYKTTVRIEAGRTTKVSQSLKPRTLISPPYGRLRTVGFEKFAAVFVNGGYMGHTDEFNASGQGLLLNPGEYNVSIVSQAGSTVVEQKLTIETDKTFVLSAR